MVTVPDGRIVLYRDLPLTLSNKAKPAKWVSSVSCTRMTPLPGYGNKSKNYDDSDHVRDRVHAIMRPRVVSKRPTVNWTLEEMLNVKPDEIHARLKVFLLSFTESVKFICKPNKEVKCMGFSELLEDMEKDLEEQILEDRRYSLISSIAMSNISGLKNKRLAT